MRACTRLRSLHPTDLLLSIVLDLTRLVHDLVRRAVQLIRARWLLAGDVPVDPRQHRDRRHTEPAGGKEPQAQQRDGDHRGDENRTEDDERWCDDGEGDDGAGKDQRGEDQEGAARGDGGGRLDDLSGVASLLFVWIIRVSVRVLVLLLVVKLSHSVGIIKMKDKSFE